MRLKTITSILAWLVAAGVWAQKTAQNDTVKSIPEFRNMYHYQNFYLSGQPTYEALQWLQSQGVKRIINLRSERENSEFAAGAFNEAHTAGQLGFEYHSLPVDGNKDYTPAKLDTLAVLLETDDPVLIHCMSAVRVSYFFMAWLVKYRGYTLNQAAAVGKQIAFSIPLEKLLGIEILMESK